MWKTRTDEINIVNIFSFGIITLTILVLRVFELGFSAFFPVSVHRDVSVFSVARKCTFEISIRLCWYFLKQIWPEIALNLRSVETNYSSSDWVEMYLWLHTKIYLFQYQGVSSILRINLTLIHINIWKQFPFRYATLLSMKGRLKCILNLLDQNIYGKGFHFSTKDKFSLSYWKKSGDFRSEELKTTLTTFSSASRQIVLFLIAISIYC